MREKIVFFDIDGTLLTKEHKIPESTIKAIHELQQKGVYTAIATGRTPGMFDWIREQLNIHSYVSINGQFVVFEGKEIYVNPIPIQHLEELVQDTERNGHALAYYSSEYFRASHADHPFIQKSFDSFAMEYPQVDRHFYKNDPVYQTILFCDEHDETYYKERFPHLNFLRWHEMAVDVLPKGCSKAKGIEKMIEYANIQIQNSFAFGDGLNDIEMLSYVKHGIAMGNARPELKAVADYVTTPSWEDGIYNGLLAAGLLQHGKA